MRIDYLSNVLEVAKMGSISSAAKKLWLGSTSLSAIIKGVEDALNTEIFIRTPKGVILTDAGHEILPQVEKIVEDYRILCEMVSSPNDHKSVCTLACYPALAPLLGPFVAKMLNKQQYHLNVKSTISYRVTQVISDGQADVGIATIQEGDYRDFVAYASKNNLCIERLCLDKFCLCIRGDSPLAREEDITMERISGMEHCSASFFPQFTGSYPCIDYKAFSQQSVFDDLESVKRMVASSDTVSVMPSIVFKNDIYVETGRIKLITLKDSKYNLLNVLIYVNKPHLPYVVNRTLEATYSFFAEYDDAKSK